MKKIIGFIKKRKDDLLFMALFSYTFTIIMTLFESLICADLSFLDFGKEPLFLIIIFPWAGLFLWYILFGKKLIT